MKTPWKQLCILLAILLSIGALGVLHIIPNGWLYVIKAILAALTLGSLAVGRTEDEKTEKAGAMLVFWIFLPATVLACIFL
jgi:hypothetical protein